MSILVSCEAGGSRVPAWLLAEAKVAASGAAAPQAFSELELPGHPGLPGRIPADSAAMHAARRLARRWKAPLVENEFSLNVVDVTKSPHHRHLFPQAARRWPDAVKKRLIEEIYLPYRHRIRQHLAQRLVRGATVIHLSVRSFASQGQGKTRRADMGLLYDPGRGEELDLCLDWIDEMYEELPMLKVRRNYPRRGTSDSITKAMRSECGGQRYVGIEMLLNRAWADRPVAVRDEVLDGIAACFAEVTQISRVEAA